MDRDSADRSRQSITEQHRASRMQRLRKLEAEGREVLIRAQAAIRECKLHSSRITAMIDELRAADETTVRIKALGESGS
jgi:hypothetical protein